MRGVRRAGAVEPGEAAARLPVLRLGGAVHHQRCRPARSRSSISPRRCARFPTRIAAGRPKSGPFSARVARPSRSSTRRGSGQNCDFCGSPALVDYQEIKAPIRPQSLLPFVVTDASVREQIRKWYASKWLAPGKLKSRALVDRVHGVYIPYWTFDAQVLCPWNAEAGHYYYTTETYREGGRTRTRQVRHVRWVPAAGQIEHFFDDEPVPGTRGVSHSLLVQVEPFPTKELKPYDTAFLSGFVVEHYQVVLFDAAKRSQDAMHAKLTAMCGAQVPGDTYRNLQIRPVYSGQTFKHILVPVWLLTYNFGAKSFQVVVNGVTGRMAGDYPKSFWKIALLVLLAIIAVVVFVTLAGE